MCRRSSVNQLEQATLHLFHSLTKALEDIVARIAAIHGGIGWVLAQAWGRHFNFDAALLTAEPVAPFWQIVWVLGVAAMHLVHFLNLTDHDWLLP